jgi:hypothetical protein
LLDTAVGAQRPEPRIPRVHATALIFILEQRKVSLDFTIQIALGAFAMKEITQLG